MNASAWILPTIVCSQFCCTSLWFATNGVMGDLVSNFNLDKSALGHLTSAVQFGFITGTLLFAMLTISDRFPPSKVFFISALMGALCNLGPLADGNGITSLVALRFLTGFFLAGIYPVGMKIAADYYDKTLGRSLGLLVGALVVGTAFPHLLSGVTNAIPWTTVLAITSALAVSGGLLMFILVPPGPYRKSSQKFDFSTFFKVFKSPAFRSAAFGYFGHMWELYAFWAFVPVMLTTYISMHPTAEFNLPILSFMIIGIGGLACIVSGYISEKVGAKRTACIALLLSCGCCIVSPLFFLVGPGYVFIGFLLFWGMVVIADSPLFSTLVAQKTEAESKGTALTIVNCIGFSITIVSIQLLNVLRDIVNPNYMYIALAFGPMLGLFALYQSKQKGSA